MQTPDTKVNASQSTIISAFIVFSSSFELTAVSSVCQALSQGDLSVVNFTQHEPRLESDLQLRFELQSAGPQSFLRLTGARTSIPKSGDAKKQNPRQHDEKNQRHLLKLRRGQSVLKSFKADQSLFPGSSHGSGSQSDPPTYEIC